jgi:hypothetical protein
MIHNLWSDGCLWHSGPSQYGAQANIMNDNFVFVKYSKAVYLDT